MNLTQTVANILMAFQWSLARHEVRPVRDSMSVEQMVIPLLETKRETRAPHSGSWWSLEPALAVKSSLPRNHKLLHYPVIILASVLSPSFRPKCWNLENFNLNLFVKSSIIFIETFCLSTFPRLWIKNRFEKVLNAICSLRKSYFLSLSNDIKFISVLNVLKTETELIQFGPWLQKRWFDTWTVGDNFCYWSTKKNDQVDKMIKLRDKTFLMII